MTGRRPRSKAPETDRKTAILSDRTIRSWHEERSLRSALSADVDVRKLSLLLERIKLTPEGVVQLAKDDPDALRAGLVRYATDLKRRGRLDTYIAKTFSGLKSYLAYRHVTFDGFPRLEQVAGASIANERVPTPEELGRVLQRLSLRGRTVALFMAHSGLRPQVLGGYRGEKGLTLGDLPELDLDSLTFREIPFLVRVPASLSKTRAGYVSFGTNQASEVVRAYLAERREGGEKLTAGSPVIAAEWNVRGAAKAHLGEAMFKRGFLATGNIVAELARVLHASAAKGERLRPYSLRAYCSTRMLQAEGDGRVSRDLREAILGHNTGVAGRYNVGKKWGSELLAEARKEYRNAAEFLETNASPKVDVRGELDKILTQAIEKAKAGGLDINGLEALQQGLSAPKTKDSTGSSGSSAGTAPTPRAGQQPPRTGQKVVLAEEVEAWIEKGARYVAPLNGTKAIIEVP
jgi:integrase